MKKFFLILSLILFFATSATIPVYAENVFSSTIKKVLKIVGAKVKFPSGETQIRHTPISSVSAIDRILKAKIAVDFKDYVSATAKILYYLNDDKSTMQQIPKKQGKVIKDGQDFYIALPDFSESDTSVSYKIEVEFKDADGNIEYEYYPTGKKYKTAYIIQSTQTFINADSGGTLVFESGNQLYKYTQVNINENSLNKDSNITITQLPIEEMPIKDTEMVAMYRIEADEDTEILSPVDISLYWGVVSDKTKFSLKYRENPAGDWKTVNISKVDLSGKVINALINKFGEYAIFVNNILTDNDYRPEKRVKVKARIPSYGGFKFRNLKEGDSVRIFNINGKKIREIVCRDSKGYVEWTGQKDNGDWAESGTYVYQIKLKEKDKVISGTIAFVW